MIAIVKYNAGNIGSVQNALNRLGVQNQVTDDPVLLQQAEKVIFPGVGEAGTAMRYLRERGLDEVIRNLQQPALGICLGLQLMCSHSEEGDTDCLGIFDTTVKKFQSKEFKVPHMGWNFLSSEFRVQSLNSHPPNPSVRGSKSPLQDLHPTSEERERVIYNEVAEDTQLLRNISKYTDFYYVHSYYAELCENTSAACNYIQPFSSVLHKDNFFATQFHPEKSGEAGRRLLHNFLSL